MKTSREHKHLIAHAGLSPCSAYVDDEHRCRNGFYKLTSLCHGVASGPTPPCMDEAWCATHFIDLREGWLGEPLGRPLHETERKRLVEMGKIK